MKSQECGGGSVGGSGKNRKGGKSVSQDGFKAEV